MMRALIIAAVIAGCTGGAVLAVTPEAARAQVAAEPMALPADALTVTFAEDLQERFMETYGAREKATLEDDLSRSLRPLLRAGYRVNVEVLDARPNRPTFKELGDRPGLSYQSFGIGGASFRAVVQSPDGRTGEPVSYSWYEHDIHQSAFQSTWGDAGRAIDRLARRLNASVAGN